MASGAKGAMRRAKTPRLLVRVGTGFLFLLGCRGWIVGGTCIDAFRDCEGRGADSEQSQDLDGYPWKFTGSSNDQKQAERDDEGEDKKLKAAHAGESILVGDELAEIDIASDDVAQDGECQTGDEEEQDVAGSKLEVVHGIAGAKQHVPEKSRCREQGNETRTDQPVWHG